MHSQEAGTRDCSFTDCAGLSSSLPPKGAGRMEGRRQKAWADAGHLRAEAPDLWACSLLGAWAVTGTTCKVLSTQGKHVCEAQQVLT